MSEHPPEDLSQYGKRCLTVFAVVMAVTLVMVGIFYAHLANQTLAIGLTLAAAAVNAFLVASYLMHFLSERKLIYIVLTFTAIFFVGLMFLTIFARHDVPLGTMR
jgi:FtsH-binding integral membrane protein